MSAQTSAPRPFVDGIEKAAFEAGHVSPIIANLGDPASVPAPVDRVAHLEAIAERQADQRRVDALRIAELEDQLAKAVDLAVAKAVRVDELERQARDAGADRIADLADERDRYQAQIASLREQLEASDERVGELLRQRANSDKAYREVRHALAEAEDQRDNYRRLAGLRLEENTALRNQADRVRSALDERAGRRWLGQG
jgi:chromosome segregation ATPase